MTSRPTSADLDETLVRRLWLLAVCLLLGALAFSIDPTRIVGDTKIDLTINPLGFLHRALHLWDSSYFGQLQNQAYGYLFPNGPFHALCVAAGMPEWIVQRLWMALLLCAAFLGTVAVARALGIGGTRTQIIAGAAFALSPRVLTLLSYNSAELQPTMLLPWVLLPLIHGARGRTGPVRAAALSAAAFAFCGGTNAASELAVLVVPLLYLLTRARGPRTLRLLLWWLTAIFCVSFWWLAPLLIMARYVFSFMPFTEDAAVTTSVTSLVNTLRGTANWMGYVPGEASLPAGSELAAMPWLILATALVAALGLAGAVHRHNPERLFLGVCALAGTAIMVSGYTGPLSGPLAPLVQNLLDGALSPFRNIHKFDVLVRVPIVLGLAHLPTAAARREQPPGRGPARARPANPAGRLTAGACAIAVLATLTPLATVGGATRGGFPQIPDYWYEATAWLDTHGRGSMTMAVPGSARGEYLWGRPMDEPMQPLMRGAWTNQQIIPWGSAGVSRLTHAIDQRLSSGRGSKGLARTLARMGVRYLLVRNDLQREGNNGGWPARVHQALADSPGISHVRSFGPTVGSLDAVPAARWYDQPYPALDVYAVHGPAPAVGTVPAADALRVTGGPEALLALAEQGLLTDDRPVLLGDDPGAERVASEDTVTTDTVRRVEVSYPDVRRNVTNTLTADEELERGAPAPDVLDPAWEPYTSVAAYDGIVSVTASSSEAGALAGAGTRDPGRMPYAALDGSSATSWRSSGFTGAVGQWLAVEFDEPRDLTGLSVAFERLPGEPLPARVTVSTDNGSTAVGLDGTDRPQELTVPPGETTRFRIRVDELAWEPEYRFGTRVGITSIGVPGMEAARTIEVPGVADTGTVLLTGSTGTVPGCMEGSRVWVCHPDLAVQGEDSHVFDRTFTLSERAVEDGHTISGQVVVIDPAVVENAANRGDGYPKVTSSSTAVDHPAAMGRNAFDSDPATVWYPAPEDPRPSLRVELGRTVELTGLTVDFPRVDAVHRPVRIVVEAGGTVRSGWVDGSGGFTFAPLRAKELTISFAPPEGQPLEVRGIELPGVDPLGPVGDEPLTAECGRGPALRVNGTRVETRISGGTLRDRFEGRPLEFTSCTDLRLVEGSNRLVVEAGNQYQVRSAVVRAAESRLGGGGPVRLAAVSVAEWGPGERRVEVDAAEDSYLVVNENFNEGWAARLAGADTALEPVRLEGWKQAWLLPAGASGTVVMTYTPDTLYHAVLGGGALLAAMVFALAFAPRRTAARSSRLPAAASGRIGSAAAALIAVAFGAWVAGAVGAAAAVLGTLASRGTRRWARLTAAGWVAAGSLALAGLSLAVGTHLAVHSPFHDLSALLSAPLRGWVAQLLCLPAMIAVASALPDPVPGAPERRAGTGRQGRTGDDPRDGAVEVPT